MGLHPFSRSYLKHLLTTDFQASMSDLFRGRSSTWSAGTPVADGDPDSVPGYEYSDTSLAVQNTPVGASNNNAAQIDQISTGVGRPGSVSGFLYSPASSTHTTTELGSQEFSTARRLGPEKTPESSTSDCNNNYGQAFYTASSPRNSRDWTGTTSSGGGFQASNFSVHSVAASSPYGRHPESGGVGSSLLPPCGGPYESPSPYTNGQQQQQQQPGLHSGSPSSAGSQISCAQQPGINRTSVGGVGGIGSTSAQQSQPLVPANSVSGKRPARRNPWGSETYSDLIAKAIESYPEKQATLQQIYDYISTNYSFFRERSDPPASAGWKVGNAQFSHKLFNQYWFNLTIFAIIRTSINLYSYFCRSFIKMISKSVFCFVSQSSNE